MILLAYARLLIAVVPLRLWRNRFGLDRSLAGGFALDEVGSARTMARHVDRAAARMPFARKCLPRAMALSLLLRRRGIAHAIVFAIRPREPQPIADRLHAWVEQDGALLIGDEPGPWVEVLRLGQRA